ncbi:YibE/F family protein [Micromonospora sp. MS34]|uniref:YibE/F family protein n=1 Tax=Micromonospora sp. MS34 TaxID=3385971 RepID=UPI0039A296E1
MGAGHGHGHLHPPPASRRVRRVVAAVIVPMLVATVVMLVTLWPREPTPTDPSGANDRRLGTVTALQVRECAPDEVVETPSGVTVSRCGSVTVRLTEGTEAGRTVQTEVPSGPGSPRADVGDDVVVLALTDPADPSSRRYAISDHQRGVPLAWLAVLVAVAVIGFGRLRGAAALAGLAVTFAVLLLFVLPAIVAGQSPLLVAVVGSATIMFVVLYLTHGVSVRTSVAVLGTLASLVLTGAMAALAMDLTHLTGYGSEDASTLGIYYQDVDLHGLLLAGIIIGSLGVLDDITVTQAETVAELAAANPAMSRRQLYRAATRVGRAHIASVVNTIVLAYAGASLPVLVLLLGSGRGIEETLNSEFIAQEIVRSLVGTLGLVAAVPLTTALAALVTAGRARRPAAEAAGEPTPRPRPADTDPPAAVVVVDPALLTNPWEEPPPTGRR